MRSGPTGPTGTNGGATGATGPSGSTGTPGATGPAGPARPEAFMNATGGPEAVADGADLLFAGPSLASGIAKVGGVFTLGFAGTYLVDVSAQASTGGAPGAVFQFGAYLNGVLVARGTFSTLLNTFGALGGSFIIVTATVGATLEIRNIISSGASTNFDEERLTIVRTGP